VVGPRHAWTLTLKSKGQKVAVLPSGKCELYVWWQAWLETANDRARWMLSTFACPFHLDMLQFCACHLCTEGVTYWSRFAWEYGGCSSERDCVFDTVVRWIRRHLWIRQPWCHTTVHCQHQTGMFCLLPPLKKEVMFLVQSVCLSVRRITHKLVNGFWRNFWRGRAWLKDQVIQFWWRSGSRFGSGSPKSEIRILRIGGGLCSLSIDFLLVLLLG